MGDVKKYFDAAKSDGNKIAGIEKFTNVDTGEGQKDSFEIFQWVFNKFSGLIRHMQEHQLQDLMQKELIYKAYEEETGHAASVGESATIAFAVLWAWHIGQGVKIPVYFAYAAIPEELDGDTQVDVLMGKQFNCIIPAYFDKENMRTFSIYVGVHKAVRSVEIINIGLDSCQIDLASTKEGY